MCGIFGAISDKNILNKTIDGLERLEYRGYDSAGVAIAYPNIKRFRTVGRVQKLRETICKKNVRSNIAISHTRWATHGKPVVKNAHPHLSNNTAIVHNGIIENFEVIKTKLNNIGYKFQSETDSEVIAHYINYKLSKNLKIISALSSLLNEFNGSFAVALINTKYPNKIFALRNGAPLIIGLDKKTKYVSSDSTALNPYTKKLMHLEDGDIASIDIDSVKIFNKKPNKIVKRKIKISSLSNISVDLGKYKHFMQKEIFEQPNSIRSTLESTLASEKIDPKIFGINSEKVFLNVNSILILACGTSYHAGLVARYWIEEILKLPCYVEIASEYRYRKSVSKNNQLIVVISQSGETADTISALNHAKKINRNNLTLGICNVPESTLIRQTNLKFLTKAGPEIGVASTKAFTTQLVSLFLLTICITKTQKKLHVKQEKLFFNELKKLPDSIEKILKLEGEIKKWAKKFHTKNNILFLGRGLHFPIALEGALKLKEISYIHAEAYAAGELKHGPLALVDKNLPVIAVAPDNHLISKLKSNLEEVKSRGGKLYVILDARISKDFSKQIFSIKMTAHLKYLSPILYSIPLQLIAYNVSLLKKTDIDKPRNLAKSVTVE